MKINWKILGNFTSLNKDVETEENATFYYAKFTV